jgi:hypothetical protein
MLRGIVSLRKINNLFLRLNVLNLLSTAKTPVYTQKCKEKNHVTGCARDKAAIRPEAQVVIN